MGGTRTVLEEALRAEVERVVLHLQRGRARARRRAAGTADETQLFTAGHLGIPYVNSVHEAEAEALRLAAQGPAAGVREPDGRVRARATST